MTTENLIEQIKEVTLKSYDDVKKWLNDRGFYQYYNPEHWVTSKIKYCLLGNEFKHDRMDYTNYGFTQKEAVAYQILIIDNDRSLDEFTSKKWN